MAVPLDHRDLKRRHPLCPHCRYDLIATVTANKRVCPECGEPFELSDVVYETRAGDWSNGQALVRGGRALAWRLVLAWAVALALSALAIMLLNMSWPRIVPFLAAVFQACLVGMICSRGLNDEAGYHSGILVIGACLAATAATYFGFLAAALWLITPTMPGAAFLHVGVAMPATWLWIIHHLLIDDQ